MMTLSVSVSKKSELPNQVLKFRLEIELFAVEIKIRRLFSEIFIFQLSLSPICIMFANTATLLYNPTRLQILQNFGTPWGVLYTLLSSTGLSNAMTMPIFVTKFKEDKIC